MAKSVDELLVYQRAFDAAREVSAIVCRPSFQRDQRLRDQLGAASSSVAALIAEGFEQSTDRYFGEYLYRARGSAREVRTELAVARDRHHISDGECTTLSAAYEEIGRMLTGLIRYLESTRWKHRK